MAGIYIHIPFCRSACHYCNFHFTTSLRRKNELIAAIVQEANLQNSYLDNEPVETVYLGGGTPSLLSLSETSLLLDTVRQYFPVSGSAEITLEANPDDIYEEKLEGWKAAGINRLSIGIQSFFERDLHWMNRAHTASQALQTTEMARRFFDNITIDLIYGTPGLSDEEWMKNLIQALAMDIPHLSCYALTVEPKTPLHKMIRQQQKEDTDPEKQARHFMQLMNWAAENGFEHYEISNFARPGYRSRHNTAYWQGKKYLGLGPSAHSYNGSERQWNVANNSLYIQSVQQGLIPGEKERLTTSQQFNEYIMIALRTAEGIQEEKATVLLGQAGRPLLPFIQSVRKYIQKGMMQDGDGFFRLTNEGKLLADGIAADLFLTET